MTKQLSVTMAQRMAQRICLNDRLGWPSANFGARLYLVTICVHFQVCLILACDSLKPKKDHGRDPAMIRHENDYANLISSNA